MQPRKYAKAIAHGLAAGAGALGVAYADGTATAGEWWTALGAVIAGTFVVWRVPNRDAAHGDTERRRGHGRRKADRAPATAGAPTLPDPTRRRHAD